ncbi:SHOCT domain-containing protein [Catellatospora sp. KI3]|uniref:SHOCT domain-containing protein n=1 Tax=Catellatospora sp. KI3 TaxID=3041620 RepID=UPI0024823441|nr:SHOCT domain-containing protein [Catellatospora sp. KI3]MDI1466237.1 SHOCT domain-containing protein [Catellatospora sp. KI3]
MGLLRGVARTAVIAGTATAVSNRVSRRQAGRWAEQEQADAYQQQQQQAAYAAQQQAYAAPPPPPPAAAPAAGDPMAAKIEQLKSLADLKAQGVLTDAEFEQQKNAILAG